MITAAQCLSRYGRPEKESAMVLWHVPSEIQIATIPSKIYCNKDLVEPLTKALTKVRDRGLAHEIIDYSGCFAIRRKRGSQSTSLHSWGLAVDLSAGNNLLGKTYDQLIKMGRKPLSEAFLDCFRESGFVCGGDWKGRPDRMHQELAYLPDLVK